jgi:hypothetical protein
MRHEITQELAQFFENEDFVECKLAKVSGFLRLLAENPHAVHQRLNIPLGPGIVIHRNCVPNSLESTVPRAQRTMTTASARSLDN